MNVVEELGEPFARRLSRRRFLHKAAGTTFGAVAAFAVEGIFAPRAYAITCPNPSYPDCGCQPIGPYCNTINSSYCSGAACAGPCVPYTGIYGGSANGCWCTKDCCYNNGTYSGYYKCCDCSCHGTLCSCRKFHYTCQQTAASADSPDPIICC
jgi:hypothetical protein